MTDEKMYVLKRNKEEQEINYDKVLNQYNTKVWVFKNINKEKIDIFKRLWVEK